MTLDWGKRQPTPNGWYMVTAPERFSITFVRGSRWLVLGMLVSNGRHTDRKVVSSFETVEAAQAEAERIAAGGRA